MLKHLPTSAKDTLLNVGNFPPSWRTSTVIPVLKPGKEESDPGSYRPIALSCICKIMERMINDRRVWYLEKNKSLTPVQCGFRKCRSSTTDDLVRLETFVRETFVQRQHCVAVFFDLEKACNTTWKYGIMNDLHNAGLRGTLSFIYQRVSEGQTIPSETELLLSAI